MPSISALSASTGHAGTTLTITGSGFLTTTPAKVNFGARSVTVTPASGTSITGVAVPTLCAGSYPVSVTQAAVTSNSLPFYYIGTPACSGLSAVTGPLAPAALTVYGDNLSTVTGVTFGAAAGTGLTVTSDTQFDIVPPDRTATPPTGTTETVDVTITTGGGSSFSAGSASQFTYYNPPTVTGLSPSGGSPAGGITVTITGTNFADVSAVDFGGTAAVSFDQNTGSSTSLTAVVPALAAGSYAVHVTTPGGVNTTGPSYVVA